MTSEDNLGISLEEVLGILWKKFSGFLIFAMDKGMNTELSLSFLKACHVNRCVVTSRDCHSVNQNLMMRTSVFICVKFFGILDQ